MKNKTNNFNDSFVNYIIMCMYIKYVQQRYIVCILHTAHSLVCPIRVPFQIFNEAVSITIIIVRVCAVYDA